MSVRQSNLPIKSFSFVLLGSLSPFASAHVSCLTQGFKPLSVAYEIVDIGTVSTNPEAAVPTYKGDGTNPISGEVWNAGYAPPAPYVVNTTRYLQFNESQFIASPGETICNTAYITTSDGYTWGAMSEVINAMWPYHAEQYTGQSAVNAYYAGNLVNTPPPGTVKVTVNYKAQNILFWANQDGVAPGTPGAVPLNRYIVQDQWGNKYIMHASGQSTDAATQQAFNDAVLPAGWTKFVVQLKKDFTIYPAVGSDGSFQYGLFRDSADNTYHQFYWSRKGSLEAQVPGMPIWGGQSRDVLSGDANGPTNDLIHGAGGNDKLYPGSGDDTVFGDDGIDLVGLPGTPADYTLVALSSDLNNLELFSSTYGSKVIRYAEFVKIGKKTIAIKNIRKVLSVKK